MPQEVKNLTSADIVEIIKAARTPVKTEKELRDEAVAQQERAEMKDIFEQGERNKAADQNGCQHEYPTGVGTPVVYIASLNRLYCQHCALWIFQTVQEAAFNHSKVDPTLHPALWNRYFTKAMMAGLA